MRWGRYTGCMANDGLKAGYTMRHLPTLVAPMLTEGRLTTPCHANYSARFTIRRAKSRDSVFLGYSWLQGSASFGLHRQCCIHSGEDFNFLHGCCVGQAANPGPWTLMTRNVVSAQKHVDDLEYEADCIVWSETTATKFTQERVLKKGRTIGYRSCFSNPVSQRTANNRIGRSEASGAIILSQNPLQDLAGVWDHAVFSTGRVADALLQLPNIQIRVIAVYGYHAGIPDSVSKNDKLLSHVFAAASQYHMPVIITGDLNCNILELECWSKATTVGFVDIAEQEAIWRRQIPDMTYRGETRIDYVICNAWASSCLNKFSVDPNGYTDHAILHATFSWDGLRNSRPRWQMPSDVANLPHLHDALRNTKPDEESTSMFWKEWQCGSPSDTMTAFCQSFETKLQRVHHAVIGKPLPSSFLGRGRGKIVSASAPSVVVCKLNGTATCRKTLSYRYKALNSLRELQFQTAKGSSITKRYQLWLRILKSPGFSPDFATWILDELVIATVPLNLPDLQWINSVIDALAPTLKHWNNLQGCQRRRDLAQTFTTDWKSGGRLHASSIKDCNFGTLDGLMITEPFEAVPVDVKKGCTDVFRIPDSQLCCNALWNVDGQAVQVSNSSSTHVRLERPIKVGHVTHVTQTTWCCDPPRVAAEVQRFWNGYWNSGRCPDPNVMHDMVERIPQLPTFSPWVSAEELQQVVTALPLQKARGTDNWSNAELKLLCYEELVMLAALFNQVLESGTWPHQLLSAVVTLLAKTATPTSPRDARLITILPTIYRLFGKVMSKKIFQAITRHLPPGLFGSVPGKSTEDAAWALQSSLEEALITGHHKCGVSLDLSKAYNTLPRECVLMLANRTGWPHELTRAYLGYLDSLERLFKVDRGCYAATQSKVGVPEGDPIAVPVMILFTWGFTLLAEQDNCNLLSYVDNWALLADNPAQVQTVLDHTKEAADGLALLLNPDKTKVFATKASDRAALRNLSLDGGSLHVVHNTNDLGVVFTSTNRATSVAISKRLQSNESKLRRLQAMPWSSTRKQEVLQRVIAPSLFYGVVFSSTSISLLASIRAKFSSAIWGPQHHRNHFLTPLFSLEKVYEPFVAVLIRRVSSFRRQYAIQPEAVLQSWNLALGCQKSLGPVTYLFQQMSVLQWIPAMDGDIVGQSGLRCNLLRDNLGSIRHYLLQDWLIFVASQLECKPEFAMLRTVDWDMTIRMRKTTGAKVFEVGCFTSGAAMFTTQKLKFLEAAEAVCMFCGKHDSQRHRLFECEHYSSLRPHQYINEMESWPALLTERGLFKKPLAIREWEAYTHSLPIPEYAVFFHERVSLFTDGSTFNPTTVPCSAWAVVLADPDGLDSTLVAKGALPGKQCNYRAELWAVLVAAAHATVADLYVDNQSVLQGLWRLQRDGWIPLYWTKQPECFLWQSLWHILRTRSIADWSFHHVKSHQNMDAGNDFKRNWEIWYNNAVDVHAKDANSSRELHAKRMYQRALHSWSFVARQAAVVYKLQTDVLHHSRSNTSNNGTVQAVPALDVEGSTVSFVVPRHDDFGDSLLCPPFLDVLQAFIRETVWVQTSVGCSVPELYAAFVALTGWVVPINIGQWPLSKQPLAWRTPATTSIWIHESSYPELTLCRQSFSKQCNTFMNALRYICKRNSIPADFARQQSLARIGHFAPVSTFPWWPSSILHDPKLQLSHTLGSCTLEAFNKKVFAPSSIPRPASIAQPHPSLLWNSYCMQRRLRQRA